LNNHIKKSSMSVSTFEDGEDNNRLLINPLPPNVIYICMSYRTANLQTLHFKYFFNKYPY
jgi:hypothetical protein